MFWFSKGDNSMEPPFFPIAGQFWIAKILYFKMLYGSKPPCGGGGVGVPGHFTLFRCFWV